MVNASWPRQMPRCLDKVGRWCFRCWSIDGAEFLQVDNCNCVVIIIGCQTDWENVMSPYFIFEIVVGVEETRGSYNVDELSCTHTKKHR